MLVSVVITLFIHVYFALLLDRWLRDLAQVNLFRELAELQRAMVFW